jgi:hypothetical protein
MLAAMKVDWSPQLQATRARRDVRPGSDGRSFADEVTGEVATSQPAAASNIGGVDGLFLLQEVGDEAAGRRRRAAARGSALLDRLDEIRVGLLSGSLPRTQLEQLRQLAREQSEAGDDPRLAAIIDDIELRVAVELAKLETVV